MAFDLSPSRDSHSDLRFTRAAHHYLCFRGTLSFASNLTGTVTPSGSSFAGLRRFIIKERQLVMNARTVEIEDLHNGLYLGPTIWQEHDVIRIVKYVDSR